MLRSKAEDSFAAFSFYLAKARLVCDRVSVSIQVFFL